MCIVNIYNGTKSSVFNLICYNVLKMHFITFFVLTVHFGVSISNFEQAEIQTHSIILFYSGWGSKLLQLMCTPFHFADIYTHIINESNTKLFNSFFYPNYCYTVWLTERTRLYVINQIKD